MKKYFYIILFVVIIAGGIIETYYTRNYFVNFETKLSEIIAVQEENIYTIQEDLAESQINLYDESIERLKKLSEKWSKDKSTLHSFVPHNELREIGGLFAESIAYLDLGKKSFAIPKLKKLHQIVKNIPESFSPKLENIF